jgi:hypothetical protein
MRSPASLQPGIYDDYAVEHPKLNGGEEQKPRAKFPLMFTAKALHAMRFEPLKFVVPGFIAEGLTLFAGKPKIGKSWLLLHVAWSVATGDYTLGGISCDAGDVLYASLEDNQRRLQSRPTKLFGIKDWPSNLHFVCDMPRLAEGGLEFIEDWIASRRPTTTDHYRHAGYGPHAQPQGPELLRR